MSSSPQPCVIVIFGASGDLTMRKIIPALYDLQQAGSLPDGMCVLGFSRSDYTDQQWRDSLKEPAKEHATDFDEQSWSQFAQRLFYIAGDATDLQQYKSLQKRIDELSKQFEACGNVLFYLSVGPSIYEPIIEAINAVGLVTEGKRWCSLDRDLVPWQRIVVEKPFGHDLESAESLNRTLGRAFEEESIYRIDHYLGKELVQSLLVFRFANTIFEPLWNQHYIDHVQITAAEPLGVSGRVGFYDTTGAVRDMIQSHLLQVLALVAMEPPTDYITRHIREEKIKIIDAIEPTPLDELSKYAALGQYAGNETEPAYHELDGVANGTTTETFAALALHFDNWRWAGTPFYLRTGKRLAAKRTEIVVEFKPPAANIFRTLDSYETDDKRPPNRIIIEIAPRGGVDLRFEGKVPGSKVKLDSVEMQFDYQTRFKSKPMDAYGPLLLDVMRGDQTLFKHRHEIEGAWRVVEPFIGESSNPIRKNIQANYQPGSWGPAAADQLLEQYGRVWRNS